MSMLWFCALLLVAPALANPPQVINLGTHVDRRYHNQYSELVARILRSRGYRVWSVWDIGALRSSSSLDRRFYDSSFGVGGSGFVGGSVVDTRPTVTYEELYGGVDTSDLPNAYRTDFGPGPNFGPGPDFGPGVGPGLDGPGFDGPGLGGVGPGVDGPGPDGVGPDGFGPDGFGPDGPGLDGPGIGPGVGPYDGPGTGYVEPGYTGPGGGGVPYDTFSPSSRSTGPVLTGSTDTDFVTPGGVSGFSSSTYYGTSPTYAELYSSRSSGLGAGVGVGGGFSSGASFVDTLPAYGASGAYGYTDEYRLGGLGGNLGNYGVDGEYLDNYGVGGEYLDNYGVGGEYLDNYGVGGRYLGGYSGYFNTYRPGVSSVVQRTRYFPRRFRTSVYTYPAQVSNIRYR